MIDRSGRAALAWGRGTALLLSTVALMSADANAAQSGADQTNPTCPGETDESDSREMRFTVQETDGRPILLAEGVVDRNTPSRLSAILDTFGGDEIWLRSAGGDEQAGKQAGLTIRERGLTTHIPAGWTCHGACSFMFMGGIARSVDGAGFLMVATGEAPVTVPDAQRQRPDIDQTADSAQAAALLATEDFDYLIRMGISRNLLTDIIYAPAESGSTRRCLTAGEMARYNVTSRVLHMSPVSDGEDDAEPKR